MFVINQPIHEVLDEGYFTNFMRWFMLGIDHTPYQLPGLAIVVSPFVYLFGDNYFAWRLPIIIFGMVFLYFYYKTVEHIVNKKISLLSTTILALSPMIFIHSSLMLRDIPVMALGFFSVYLYFKNKYYFSALIIGLSAIIKETAIFFMIFIMLWSIVKIIKQKDIKHKNIITYIILNCKTKSKIKKSIIFVSIISSAFFIPLLVYENTVEVLEYTTKNPEFLVSIENIQKIMMFEITQTDSFILEKPISDFNYIDKVTDPIHHLNLFFTKGYYQNTDTGNEFLASFLPIKADIEQVRTEIDSKSDIIKAKTTRGDTELHRSQFKITWIQSIINYSYWLVAFWGIIALITYAIYDKVKNQKSISTQSIFLIFGLIFFIPFLFIDIIRDAYAYYMIYYLPFMALGLVLLISRIKNKQIQVGVLCSFLIAISVNFVWYFPIKLLG